MHTNPTWKDWFIFSKRQRTIVVTAIILLTAYLSFRIFYQPSPEAVIIENLDEKIALLSSQNSDSVGFQKFSNETNNRSYPSANATVQLFYFDPNTIDEAGFAQLGFREKTIHTIINYRSKGGRFYKPDDLRKIYGLKEEEANRLVPYVRIASSQNQPLYTEKYKSDAYSYHKPKPQVIDINSASAEQWQSLPAIGEVLSNRIVKYRDKIGGFASVGDVKKVYGITDSAYKIILPYLSVSADKPNLQTATTSKSTTSKININKATATELKSNPDIPSDIAEAIVIYRKQHGNYTSVEGIKKIVFINNEVYQKIAPLLTVE